MMAEKMRYRVLGDMKLSIMGLGGSGYGGIYGEYDEQEAIKALRSAILDKGINYIDTAPFYGIGRSETVIGRALVGIPREKYFIGTKVGRYQWEVEKRFDFTAQKTMQSIEESLQRLQLSYVDVLQVHDVEFAPSVDMVVKETLPAVQKLKEKGLCHYIGITGYPLAPMKEIISKSSVKIDCILSHCRLTLNDSSLVEDFDFFKARGISIINASPLSLGLLTEQGVQPWNSSPGSIREACRKAVQYCADRGIDITRLAVNHSTSYEEAVTTLIATRDTAMLEKNIDSALNPLTDEEKDVKEYLEETFFKPLPTRHWEGLEIKKYWQELKRIQE